MQMHLDHIAALIILVDFFEKEDEAPNICIIVMHTNIFVDY